MPAANAQLHGRQETRSGLLESKANGHPTDAKVQRVREEIDYQRAVQACIHFIPAVGMMQWRNGHLGPLGAKAYELVVPKDVPMLNFWSVVLYDVDTRGMIVSPQGKTEVNSRQPLVRNKDGSVRLVFSPTRPAGVPDANGIQTNPKKGWFTCFCWYSPTKAFFDRSWKMGNIAELN